jgi:hypothetical protein
MCALNPMYGHGMSIAALEARLLRTQLERRGATIALGAKLRAPLAAALAAPWAMSTSEDYRYPGTCGAPRSWAMGVRHRFGDAVAHAALHDHALHYRWLRVVHLVDPPASLLRPPTMWRIARANLLH